MTFLSIICYKKLDNFANEISSLETLKVKSLKMFAGKLIASLLLILTISQYSQGFHLSLDDPEVSDESTIASSSIVISTVPSIVETTIQIVTPTTPEASSVVTSSIVIPTVPVSTNPGESTNETVPIETTTSIVIPTVPSIVPAVN